MKTFLTVLAVIVVIVLILLIVLFFVGRRMQRKQAAQQKQIDAAKQTVSILVIDKGKRKLKEAGLTQAVLDQVPKYMRGVKFPVVKAKVGPQVMTLLCDGNVYDLIPVKKTVKATISGIYITDVRAVRGTTLETPPAKKKHKFLKKLQKKADAAQKELEKEKNAKNNSKKKK